MPSPHARPSFLETVPVLWPDSTIICIGSGPSLMAVDVQQAFEAGAHLLAVNDAVRITGKAADVLFAADATWWQWNTTVPDDEWPLQLWTVDPEARQFRPSVHVVNYNGSQGLEMHRDSIRTGGHSGYMAINLAAHFGAKKIILLGYDLQKTNGQHHFFGDHPDHRHLNYEYRRGVYETLLKPLSALGIRIINASRTTALTAIPRATLTDALEM